MESGDDERGESDGTEGRRQRGTKCNTGGPRDVRPELWTQMTASSTAAVEADERQNEAECLGAASGQKHCSAHNKKNHLKPSPVLRIHVEGLIQPLCEGRVHQSKKQIYISFLVGSLGGVLTCRQFWFRVSRL